VKECPEHGRFRTLFWRDADMFRRWLGRSVHAPKQTAGLPFRKGCPYDCGVCEKHEGGVCTAVLEITYRCNMACSVCFADAEKENYEPDLAEIRSLYETASRFGGNCSIQLSGGEPTVREDLPEILRLGKDMGFSHIQVNTNGLRLAGEPGYAEKLKEAGADLIYLQFDAADDEVYRAIRGRPLLEIKRAAIRACAAAGLGVLLVPTVIPGLNLSRIGQIVDFAKAHMPVVKGIHFQPVSYFGRYPDGNPEDGDRCGLDDVIHALEEQTRGEISRKNLVSRERYDPHCAFSGVFYLREDGALEGITQEKLSPGEKKERDYAKEANRYTNTYWRMNEEDGGKEATSKTDEFWRRFATHTLSVSGMGFQDVWNIDIARLHGCCVHVMASGGRSIPLCAFHLTGTGGERIHRNEKAPL
jgi:uncharacterized radical SAM superfamily Fe-S cluster-containing enzyme